MCKKCCEIDIPNLYVTIFVHLGNYDLVHFPSLIIFNDKMSVIISC